MPWIRRAGGGSVSVLRMRALADAWEIGLEAVLVIAAAGLANVLYFAFSTP